MPISVHKRRWVYYMCKIPIITCKHILFLNITVSFKKFHFVFVPYTHMFNLKEFRENPNSVSRFIRQYQFEEQCDTANCRGQANPEGICGGKKWPSVRLSPEYLDFHLSVSFYPLVLNTYSSFSDTTHTTIATVMTVILLEPELFF